MDELNAHDKLTNWLHQMGYPGEIPKNLTSIANPRSSFIWEQVVNFVKPRSEISHIRNNLIINRLSVNRESDANPITYLVQNECNYPIREIEVWKKKQTLDKQVVETNQRINELETRIGDLNQQNKAKYLGLQNVQQKAVENQKLCHLLLKKTEELNNEVVDAEDKITLVCNLTPISESNEKDVLVLLNKCSEKLEKLSQKQAVNTTVFKQSTPKSVLRNTFAFSTKKNLNDSLGLLGSYEMDATLNCDANSTCDLEVLNDKNIGSSIDSLLHKNNRLSVWNCLIDLINIEKMNLLNLIVESDKKLQCDVKKNAKKEGLSKLYAIHVNHELKVTKLILSNAKRKQELYSLEKSFWKNSNVSEIQAFNLKNYFNLLKLEVSLGASIEFVQGMVNSTQSNKNHKSLQLIQEAANSLKDTIVSKLTSLEQKVNVLTSTHNSMMKVRNRTKTAIRALNKYIVDLNWMSPLSSSLILNEITTLFNFPLEYNASIMLNGEKTFMRDLQSSEISYQELSSNKLCMLSTLLQHPWSPAEVIMLKMLDSKVKLADLKGLLFVEESNGCKKYPLEDLKKQEANMFRSLDKLKSLNHHIANSGTAQTLTQLQENINFWVEMPIRNFVSNDKLFNGFPCSHYQNAYDRYYSEL